MSWRAGRADRDGRRFLAVVYFAVMAIGASLAFLGGWLIRWRLHAPSSTVFSADAVQAVISRYVDAMWRYAVPAMGIAIVLLAPVVGRRSVAAHLGAAVAFIAGLVLTGAPHLVGFPDRGGWFGYAPNTATIYSPAPPDALAWRLGAWMMVLGLLLAIAGFVGGGGLRHRAPTIAVLAMAASCLVVAWRDRGGLLGLWWLGGWPFRGFALGALLATTLAGASMTRTDTAVRRRTSSGVALALLATTFVVLA